MGFIQNPTVPLDSPMVAPIVATESLFGVVFSALLLRRTELVGPRLVLGAALVVTGGALMVVYR